MIAIEHPTKKVFRWPPGIADKYSGTMSGNNLIEILTDPNGLRINGPEVNVDDIWQFIMTADEPNNGGPVQPVLNSLQEVPYVFEADVLYALTVQTLTGTFEQGETISQTAPNVSSIFTGLLGPQIFEVVDPGNPGFIAGRTITGQTSGATGLILGVFP